MNEMTRHDAVFKSDDAECAAWHYRVRGRPAPCVVMAHGFGATRELRLAAFAERFAAAGYGVLVFDYRHFGASGGEPRGLIDIGGQQADWRAAIAFARTLPETDPDQVILWGSSFGGGHAIHCAARDPRVAAVIAMVPHVSGPAAAWAAGPWTGVRLAAAALRDRWRASPAYVPVLAPPGALAAMSAPGAYDTIIRGIAADDPDGSVVERFHAQNRVAARVFLDLVRYSPGRDAAKVTCPLLVQGAEHDVITPIGAQAATARRAPRGELIIYDLKHMEVYFGAAFEAIVADQIAFLSSAATVYGSIRWPLSSPDCSVET